MVEFLLRWECDTVNALQLLIAAVPPPIRTSHVGQRERTDFAGFGDVRTAAQIGEVRHLVEADSIHAGSPADQLVAGFGGHRRRTPVAQQLEELDLVLLIVPAHELDRVGDRHFGALERQIPADQLAHAHFDPREILLLQRLG